MKKLSQETKDVVTIFGRILIAILVTFLFGMLLLHYNISDNNDVYNWTSLTIEIGIGIGITWTVWKFSKRDQEKVTKLITEVQNMEQKQLETDNNLLRIVEQQKRIITEQEESIKKRRKMVLHTMKNRLEGAAGIASLVCERYDKMGKNDLDYNTGIIKYELRDAVHLAELSVDVLDYDLVHSLSTLKSVIEGHHMSAFAEYGYDKEQFTDMAKLLGKEYLKYRSY